MEQFQTPRPPVPSSGQRRLSREKAPDTSPKLGDLTPAFRARYRSRCGDRARRRMAAESGRGCHRRPEPLRVCRALSDPLTM